MLINTLGFTLGGLSGSGIGSVFDRPEVLDVIDPNYSQGITLNGSNEATQIRSRKGLFTLTNGDNTRYYQVVNFHGGKAFYRNTGTGFYLSAEMMPQQYFSMMVMHYQTLASPIFLQKNAGSNPVLMRMVSNVPTINTTSLVGSDTLNASSLRTNYYEYTSGGLALGNDGIETNNNATIINSPADAVLRFYNGTAAINGVQGYVGPLVLFKRALTDPEISFWNTYLKSTWLDGYSGVYPFSNSRDGNNSLWYISDDFAGYNANSAATPWYNQYDKTKFFQKGANTYKIDKPHIGSSTIQTDFEFLTVDSAVASITQAQPFTITFLCNIHPSYKTSLSYRQLFTNTQASDNISLMYDKANQCIRMQGAGTVGTGGITNSNFTPARWSIIKAVFNGASSSLEVDGVSVSGDVGSLGLSGNCFISPGSDIFVGSMIMNSGVVSGTVDAQNKAMLNARKSKLPDYTIGSYLVNDDFNSYHRGFGGICLKGTTLHAVYRRGVNHVSLEGEIMYVKSVDNGTTWTTESSLTNLTAGNDYRDPRISTTSSGRLVVNYFRRLGGVYTIWTQYSDDDGATWSTKVQLVPTTTRNQIGVSGYIIQLPNGDLLCPWYGFDVGNINQINGVFRSTNNGVSWTEDSVFNNPNVGDTAFQEFNIRLLQNGTILGLIRREAAPSAKEIWSTIGTVGSPIVWSTPIKATNGYGSPGFIQASNGTLWLTNRFQTLNLWIQLQKSVDNGVTWTHEPFPEPHTDFWVYGSPVQLADGRIGVLWFQQNTNEKAFGRFRFIT